VNKLSRLHDALAIISIGAPLSGLLARDDGAGFEHYAMCAVLMLLRTKFWVDDIEFFEDRSKHKGLRFQIGLTLGILSWIAFTIGGLGILDLPRAALAALVGMVLSSLWLLLAMTQDDSYKEQAVFLAFNVFYIGAFALVAFCAGPLAVFGGLALLVAALMVDLVASNFFERVTR